MKHPSVRAAFKKYSAFLWYGSVFFLSLLSCYLLSLAYPYGFISNDTSTYLWLWQSFHLWQPQQMDWIRTLPFAMVLGLSTYFPEPTAAVYWFHALLFCTGITCTAWMSAALFRSVRCGALLAYVILLVEILSLHAFVYNVFMLSDPMYAQLLLIGTMLILGGWMRKRIVPAWIGYATLGLAAFTRPVGLCLFPLWILFAAGLWLQSRRGRTADRYPGWTLLLCVFLLVGPVLGWAARNAVVYGYFRETAFGGRSVLPHVLGLVQDDDRILNDPQQNKVFINYLRAFAQEFSSEEDVYRWKGSDTIPGIFETLSSFMPVDSDPADMDPVLKNMRFMFRQDSFATALALRIVLLHPLNYTRFVLSQYRILLHPPFYIWPDTMARYDESLSLLQPGEDSLLYPGNIDTNRISPVMTSVVQRMATSKMLSLTRTALAYITMYGAHLLLILCASLLLCKKHTRIWMTTLPFSLTHMSVVILMLLCTALGNYFFVAMVEGTIERYAIPGETGLHISMLLGVILLLCIAQSFIRASRLPHN